MVDKSYESDNIFAKIITGDIPCHKVYEDAGTFAFLDIMPASRGHCLVIPKAPSRNLFDIDGTALAAAMMTTQKVARAIMSALEADGITIRQNNEVAGGQEVFHTHFHVMPRYHGVGLKVHDGTMADHDELATIAAMIVEAIE